MLTDAQRDILPETIENLYEELNQYVINDIARRVMKTSRLTETAELMVQSMQELGYSPYEIQKAVMNSLNADRQFQAEIAENTKEYKDKIQKQINKTLENGRKISGIIIDDAANMSFNNNLKIWAEAGKDLQKPNNLTQMINAVKKQTSEALTNITGTRGRALVIRDGGVIISLTNAYRHELDLALIKTASGVADYQQATKDVVKRLAESGVRTITYERTTEEGIKKVRTDQIDTAVRRAILTGSSQLAGHVSMQNCIDTECEYVEVDSHSGARPTHERWQGQVYKLDELAEVTGYGEISGLCGINCRHSFYPFFPGISTPRPPHIEPPPKEIDGKRYTEYEATQKQRKMERTIRMHKRQLGGLEATKLKDDELKKLIKKESKEYIEFSQKAGLRAKTERTQITK